MKNIYLIVRKDDYDYDEFDSVVVIADNEKSAFEVSYKEIGSRQWLNKYWNVENLEFSIIGQSNLESQIVLSSYNAG